jgi:hypothetical protein
MPERGGPTTQSGILYQNSLTAIYLGRLCDATVRPASDRVVRVRVEAPAHVDDTVVQYGDDRVVYVQAKERIAVGDTAWKDLWQSFAAQYHHDAFRTGRDRLRLHVGELHGGEGPGDYNALRELCDRARTADDAGEWLRRLAARQQSLVRAIAPLLAPTLAVSDAVLQVFFAHVEVERRSLEDVERDVVPLWMPPTNVAAHTLFRLLRDRVGGAARRRDDFVASTLRAVLQADDQVNFHEAPDIQALRAAVHDCGALLRQHKATLGRTGLHVSRSVVGDIADWALDPRVEHRVGLLLDHAGRGKTVVMRDVLAELEARGATVLAIKADQQLSGVEEVAALRERLNLPEPVERVANRLAVYGPVIVIVDQLDALSLSLARDQQGLNAVLDMVARVRAMPGITVLLSCRTFDRNTDPRLKRVEVGREFPLPLLEDTDVAPVLGALGLDPEVLSPATRELLRTPLHLDLFASLAATPGRDPVRLRGMQSLQDLYGMLWEEVVLRPGASGSTAAARERVVRALTARMHRDQRTSVPRSLLATLPDADAAPAADALASDGLLVPSATEWTFLHQTFFDYCYARFFVDDGRELAATVLESDQGLFTRPQVVQVLAYLRGNEHPAYLRTVDALLAALNLRVHLRDLVLRWVGALPDPSDAEWRLVYRRLLNVGLRARMLRAMAGNPAWFGRQAAGAPGGLLGGDAAFIDGSVVPYLTSIVDTDAQRAVADLVRPWLAREEPWPSRAHSLVDAVRVWRTPEAVALYEEMVAGLPMERVRHMFELDDVAEADPVAGARLVRALLDRILDAYCAEPPGLDRALRGVAEAMEVLNGSAGQKALASVSTAAPAGFLDAMVPWLERAVVVDDAARARGTDHFYAADPVTTGMADEGRVVRHVLLDAYLTSLTILARADVQAFRRVAERLAALPYTTPQLVLTRVYREVGPELAADALAFVLADARRLRLGENDAYESRMLLRALAPHLTAGQFDALERFVIAATGEVRRWYDGLAGLRWRGVDQLHLLRALPRERLSSAGRARLRELERKFPHEGTIDSPSTMRGGFVGPPIPTDACARMSDVAWLGAMAKYAGGVEHAEFLRGGATELARVLEALVQADPARFAQLAARVPDDVDDDYANAFVDGLAKSGCPPEWVYAAVRRFASPARPGVHRRAAWALGKVVDRRGELPADLLDLLEGWIRGASREDEAFYEAQPQDLHHAAINTDRGVALRVLMHALANDNSDAALQRRWALAEYVTNDPSVVLRTAGLDAILYLLRADRDRAIALFEQTVREYPRLRTTHPYQEFLYYGSFGRFARLGRHVRDLMHADAPDARRRGAELVVLSALSAAGLENDEARALAAQLESEAITGLSEWRRGAAHVYAHNWADHPTGQCETALRRLFDDPDADVRRQAAWMTHKLRPEHAVTRQEFLRAFAASHAARSGAHDFAEYLWEHGMLDPEWALSVVETLLANQHADDEHRGFGGGDDLVRLVLRIYTDHGGSAALRERAMTVFDGLMERFAGSALTALSEWDRR